jgi:glycosyltransferase involved in cell wall biosynthesis
MRLAIYHNLPSGGAKRSLHELVSRLAIRHHIDVYTLRSGDHTFADLRPYVQKHRVYDFVPTRLLPSPWGRFNQVARMRDLVRLNTLTRTIAHDIEQEGYDVLWANGCLVENAPSLLTHLKELPKVYYCQEPPRRLYEALPYRPYNNRSLTRRALDRLDPLPKLYATMMRGLDKRNLRHATRVLVNTEYSRNEIERIYQHPVHVSYLGVDSTRFTPDTSPTEKFVLSVGSITSLKGFDFLITALATIPSGHRPKLVIASNFQDADETKYLTSLAASCMVDLQLMGNVSDAQLVALYNRAYATLYAPVREPFGLVAIESMACGTPVVAVSEGGIRETVIHEENGLLTARDAKQFGAAVLRLLADPQLVAQLGAQGRAHVLAKWSWEQAVARIEQHFAATISATLSLPTKN